MNKFNQKHYFKIPLFITFLFLTIISCNKDEPIIELKQPEITLNKTKEIFNSSFNKKAFTNLKNEPLWEQAKTYFIDDKQYIEVPFIDASKFNLKKSTSISIDKLIAYKSPDGKITVNVVHYFAQDIQNNFPNVDNFLYYNLDNFNGFVTLYDLNKNTIQIDKFNRGVKSDYKYTINDKKENNEDFFNRVAEECETHTETITTETCWFWLYTDGSVEIIDCYYEYEDVTYQTCEGQNGGVGSGGTTVISEEKIVEILDKLEGKTKCIFEKFKNMSTGFKSAIQKFDGEFPVSHLKLTINNGLGSNLYGYTLPPVNYVTEIQFNENRFSNLSDLGGATIFAHEIIHAEIFRKMLSAAKKGDLNHGNSQTYTTQNRIDYVNSLKNDFPGIYDYYWKRFKPSWNHNMMASHYRNTIADMIQEFDNNRLPRSTYESLAWAGLGKIENNQNTVAWDNLSISEQQTIENLIQQNIFNGPSNCN